ncbi:hypothetical protein [Methylobacterium sp. J-070]|uniref:hypothetical protein n=1 Tax=Methylobacterium sp. J-070 TaxID=2836650 RepID=UPI001FB8FB01|nr:hypothetical protein [Methylobacterium sp. J-070]MCJ2054270.1 hypothetical protein [Methylobacterium sp. J-070]
MAGRPSKPIESYPPADLGNLPQPPAPPPGATQAAPGQAPAPARTPARAEVEAAVLDFLDPAAVSAGVPLRFGFTWEGRPVTEIPIRRLSGAEVGRIAVARGEAVELYDYYAAMAGLPKAVLRGLIDDDLEAFEETARPFLPRFMRDALSSPTGAGGAPSPAGPAAPSASPGPAS